MGTETVSTSLSTGIMLTSSGTYTAPFTVTSGGTISTGGEYAVFSSLASPSLLNEGAIIDNGAGEALGIFLTEGGTITNTAGAVINGALDGVLVDSAAATVSNAGTIIGTKHFAVQLNGGGTVINTGTIKGAIEIEGSGNARVVAGDGAAFTGSVAVSGTNNTLEFSGSSGTVASVGGQFTGFQTVAFDPGAAWDISGTAAELTGLATITGVDLGDVIDLTGFAATAASYTAGIGLVLSNATASQTLHVSGYGQFAIESDGRGDTDIDGEVQTLETTTTAGIRLSGLYHSPFAVTALGTINTGGAVGVYGVAAGTLLFNEGRIAATQSGTGTGVLLADGGTIINNGIIAGADFAVDIKGAGDALVVAGNGAVFTGTVAAAGTGNTLEFSGASDTLVSIGSQFTGFTTLNFAAGSQWGIEGNAADLSGLATITGTPDLIDLTGFAATAASYTAGMGLVLSNATSSTTLHVGPGAGYALNSDGHGGTDIVFPYSIATSASDITVNRYTTAYVASGATLTGATIEGTLFVESGALLSDAVAEPGARIFVESGGTASSTTLSDEVLYSSTSTVQNANGYVVNSTDEEIGGLVTATYVTYQLTGNVTMEVEAGGAAYNSVIDAGDTQNVDTGATAVGVTLNNATAKTVKSFSFEYTFRSYVNDTRSYGATQNVGDATVTNVTVSDNSQQNVNGGTVSNVLANGLENINSGIVSNVSITNVNASVNLNGGTLDGVSLVGVLNINNGIATNVNIEGTVFVSDYKNEVNGVPTQRGYTPTVNLNGGTLTQAHINGKLNRNGGTLLDSDLGNGSHLQYGVQVLYGENQTGGVFVAGYFPNLHHPVNVNLDQLGIGPGAIENFYGVALDTRIDGGTQNDWGGTASSTTINGGVQRIGELLPTLYVNPFGETQYFFNGIPAVAVNTTLNGGQQFVGKYIYVQVNAGYTPGTGQSQTYTASVLGNAFDTTINGGAQYIFNTGTATNTTMFGGHQQVKGGVATDTTINNGAVQILSYGEIRRYIPSIYTTLVGGTAFNTVINKGGEQQVGWTRAELAVATDTTINNGGTQYVGGLGVGASADGIANFTTINSGGKQFLSGGGGTNPGGFASSTVIENGGAQYVGVPITVASISTGGSNFELRTYGGAGFAVATTIFNGGEQFVQDHGTAVDTTIDVGGLAQVTSGGTIESAIINGGTLQLEQGAMLGAGGTVFEPYQQINPGFDKILSKSVASYSPGITFAAGAVGGVLEVTAGVGIVLNAPVYGFALGDTIDLAGFSATSYIFAPGAGLTLNNGTTTQTLDLAGSFTGEQFALATNASGTAITLEVAPGAVGPGSATTLAGSLASTTLVGGTLDVTAGGTLGSLAVTGAGSEISLSPGAVLTLATPLTLAPGATLNVAGGTLVVDGSISLTGALTESGASIFDNGTLVNNGDISLDPSTLTVVGSLTGTGVTTLGADSTLDVTGQISAGQTIILAGQGAELELSNSAYVPSGSGSDYINGTVGGVGTIDITTVPYNSVQFAVFSQSGADIVVAYNSLQDILLLPDDITGTETVTAQSDGHGGTDLVLALCYLHGTRILTPTGQVPVEDLAIGDAVVTRFGAIQRIKWLGRQRYAPRFIANNPDKWPVCITAGALADGVPARDLYVSPGHSMLLGDTLVLASQLVNGVTVTQTRPAAEVNYVQIELAGHDCVLAEGAWSETYADGPGLRAQFHNAAEYAALYPHEAPPETLRLCAARPERGPLLAAALAPVAARARANLTPGPLEGWLELVSDWRLQGWAIDTAHPALPVTLEVWLGTKRLGSVLACDFREDLRDAGKGRGYAAFTFKSPFRLKPEDQTLLTIRRQKDTTALPRLNPQPANHPAPPPTLRHAASRR